MQNLAILLMLGMLVTSYSDRVLALPKEPPPTLSSFEERSSLPGSMIVTHFEFDRNTAFSDEELTKITAPFINRPITFAGSALKERLKKLKSHQARPSLRRRVAL